MSRSGPSGSADAPPPPPAPGRPLAGARSRRGALSYRHGAAAEDQVLAAYVREGFRLAARRWRGRSGEIDLILTGDGVTLFVEVKVGRTADAAMARIGPRQVARIDRAAEEWLDAAGGGLAETRFDAALVHDGGRVTIVENALAHL